MRGGRQLASPEFSRPPRPLFKRGSVQDDQVMQVLRAIPNESPLQDNMRVLVIEDDRDAASWLVKGLTESGHVADHAADGDEGLALAREGVHDVLIVDRMLPKRDGLSIIRTIRNEGIATPALIL